MAVELYTHTFQTKQNEQLNCVHDGFPAIKG